MFKNLPNLKHLYTFESAARHQSYSLAAKALCLSQAAVSQQMRQLEAQLGYKLFFRKDKSMLLTEQGQALYQATFNAFTLLSEQINSQSPHSIAGELTVTTTQAFASLWLVPKLHHFSALHPNITIKIQSSAEFEDLNKQGIDLAIRFGQNVRDSVKAPYVSQYFGEAEVIPVCSPKTAELINATAPKDLLKTWLVTLTHSGSFSWRQWFAHQDSQADKQHDKWTQVNSTDVALNAVLNHHGVTLCATYLCQPYLDAKQLVSPLKLAHPNTVQRYFVYRKDASNMARLEVFMDWLRNEMTIEE